MTTPTSFPDLFTDRLHQLHHVLSALSPAMQCLKDPDLPDAPDRFVECPAHIVDVLSPGHGLSDEEAGNLHALSLGFKCAENASYRLLSAWEFERSGRPRMAEGFLLAVDPNNNRTGENKNIVKDLPWLLKFVLDHLLESGEYRRNTRGHVAIAIRVLSALLTALENVEGLRWEPEVGQDEARP